MTPKEIGDFGEQIAAKFLISKGFEIIAEKYHSRYGEIDLIAVNSEYLVFAEVKTRKSARYGAAGGAVTLKKQEKLRITAEQWLQEHQEILLQPRFDVIEVYTEMPSNFEKNKNIKAKIPGVRWIQNAF